MKTGKPNSKFCFCNLLTNLCSSYNSVTKYHSFDKHKLDKGSKRAGANGELTPNGATPSS